MQVYIPQENETIETVALHMVELMKKTHETVIAEVNGVNLTVTAQDNAFTVIEEYDCEICRRTTEYLRKMKEKTTDFWAMLLSK